MMRSTWAEVAAARLPAAGTVACLLLTREQLEPMADDLNKSLSDDERARRGRFVRPDDRARFGLYRGALRAVLAGCVGTTPDRLRFRVAPGGKPELDPSAHPASVRFNLSHSGDCCCIAISQTEVGVDFEAPDRAVDALAIARHSFHPSEADALAALDGDTQRALFFRWWTAKEALLKAWGAGLAGGLSHIDLSGWRDGEAARVADHAGARWIVRSYSFARGTLALASSDCVRSVILRSTSGPGAAFGALITRSS